MASLFVAAGLTACGDDGGDGGAQGGTGSGLTLMAMSGDSLTAMPSGRELALFVFGGDDTSVVSARVTTGYDGTITDGGAALLPLSAGTSVCGYIPYMPQWAGLGLEEPVEFSVAADQSGYEAHCACDLMVAPQTDIAGGRATLVFRHVMAKVTVHVTDVTGRYDLSGATMRMAARPTGVTLSLLTGAASVIEATEADLTAYMLGNNAYRASGEFILPACTVAAGGRLITLYVGGEEFTYSASEELTWRSGYEYIYRMRLTDEGLVPYESTVDDWEDGGELQ